MAELVLSSVVDTLIHKLSSLTLVEYARMHGISGYLENWESKMKRIAGVIESAEEKQMGGDPRIDRWLEELKEVAYDMEDLLDEFKVEAERIAVSEAKTGSGKFFPFLVAGCSCINPPSLLSDHRILKEIKEVDHRLGQVLDIIPSLGLVRNTRGDHPTITNQPRFLTTSLPEPELLGRDVQMVDLLHRLTPNESTDDSIRPFSVISIVGVGGIGKTTLAKELYNHESLKGVFSLKAWTCVSHVFDSFAITTELLECIAPSFSYKGNDLNSLQVLLSELLSGNKFLIVLDDIWNDKREQLENLVKPLYSGSRGSRILLTTRTLSVATTFGDHNPMILEPLSPEDSFTLLAYHSIGDEGFERHPHLLDIACLLVKSCNGLPLSVKVVGAVLRLDIDPHKWVSVLEHFVWIGGGQYAGIIPALKLGYSHLPTHLKGCLASCTLFPRWYPFSVDDLINLWTVLGLLHKRRRETFRDMGLECLRRLEDVCFLQKVGSENARYVMHDIIYEFAKSIVGATCFSSNEHRNAPGESLQGQVRQTALFTRYFERCPSSRMDVYRSMKKLRTFMHFQISSYLFSNISVSDKVLHDLIMGMKCLRALSLRCFQIRFLPDEIGELKLLRSIDVSYSLIEVLPNSISDIIDLQYLLLQGCVKLKKLPRNIHKLTKLLCLDITGAIRLKEMPPHIGNLINLEILSTFVVGKEAGQGLKELGPLKGLKQELHICNLLAVGDIEDAKLAGLQEKEGISKLSFDFRSIAGFSCSEEQQLMLLDHLKPPRRIECFRISGYGGKKFPSWFDNSCMNYVVSLTMEDCASVKSLPCLGQLPSLQQLNISGLDKVSMIRPDFYGGCSPFRSLLSLSFRGMLALEEWSSFEDYGNDPAFFRLRELIMANCPKLKRGLPAKLESLCKLDIRNCPLLETSGHSLGLPSLGEMYFERCNEGLLKCLVGVTSMTKLIIRNVPQLDRFDGSTWVSLEEMLIQNCPRLKSFMHWNGGEQGHPKLKRLVIGDCKKLKRLPDDLSRLESLKEIIVTGCRKLSSLPSRILTPTLRKVELADCQNLPSSLFLGILKSLEELTLKKLQKLESVDDIFIESHLSLSLRRLNIDDCRSLKILPAILQLLSSLSELCISHCKELELDCFPDLPCNLSKFQLVECPKVMSLPQNMHGLKSLKEVDFRSCGRITSLPKGGFPLQLEWLRIGSCESLKQPLEDWGLPQLTSLQQLHIVGGTECMDEMACFPCANHGNAWKCLLPSSLVVLDICFMEKLERLASGLREHLTSLQELRIGYCSKLRYLPDDGLPDSLELFEISGCDLLETRCSQPNGRFWPLLQHIPEVIIY